MNSFAWKHLLIKFIAWPGYLNNKLLFRQTIIPLETLSTLGSGSLFVSNLFTLKILESSSKDIFKILLIEFHRIYDKILDSPEINLKSKVKFPFGIFPWFYKNWQIPDERYYIAFTHWIWGLDHHPVLMLSLEKRHLLTISS